MARRDDFSSNVKSQLAQCAGYRCSICGKPTIGPGSLPDQSLSDGIAAHITAASKGGARFDPSLSSQQRRDSENGIWACTQHGREIDSDTPAYSVATLRGLKRIRAEVARKEMQSVGTGDDATASLIELPYADNPYTIFELANAQPYTYPTTAALRDQLRLSKRGSDLLSMASDIIISVWGSYPDVAGILSTLLSTNTDSWHPTPAILDKLQILCEGEIKSDDWSQVALTEPLAFALAAKGRTRVHSRILERLVENPRWRDADAKRIRNYYGTLGIEIAAIVRHWQDRSTKGLLRANDVGRLIEILLTSDTSLKTRPVYQQLIDLLEEQAKILADYGDKKLARRVQDIAEALRLSRNR